jgi:thiamine pyrophosphokinase
MTLANIFMLQRLWPAVDARLEDGIEEVFLIHGSADGPERVITGRAGDRVSLLALGGPAHGIITRGLVYPLRGETLFPEPARGVSNVMDSEQAGVKLREGMLICIHTRQEND